MCPGHNREFFKIKKDRQKILLKKVVSKKT